LADTVDITAGSGTKISTEEITTLNGGAVTAQHVQRVAVAARTADSTVIDLPATTADGLLVNLGSNNDVTIASLPLPSGAATAAKQPALGTAGTPSADVISIQGVASGMVVPTKEARASTPSQSSVAGSASSVTLLAANSNRLGATISNDSSAILYVKLGATASTSSFTAILAGNGSGIGGYFEVPYGYTGVIDGIWASATGNARITELTA
jgi:hypothetical protein